jgi:uncharacterized protein (DUF305 family)
MQNWRNSRMTAGSLALFALLTAPALRAQHVHAAPSPAPPAQPAHDHTAADVAFMAGMIPHHAQALDMTALVEARTQHRGIRLLAERIEVSQRDEIAWMQNWLRTRGQQVPETGGAHAHMGHHLMPGMLSPEQMADLAAASGTAFDRKFLTYMIQHHEGALVMVDTLFATPGAAQTTEVYTIATDIDADQRADIRRMRVMLAFLPPDPTAAAPAARPHH